MSFIDIVEIDLPMIICMVILWLLNHLKIVELTKKIR